MTKTSSEKGITMTATIRVTGRQRSSASLDRPSLPFWLIFSMHPLSAVLAMIHAGKSRNHTLCRSLHKFVGLDVLRPVNAPRSPHEIADQHQSVGRPVMRPIGEGMMDCGESEPRTGCPIAD
jgi:hypothetical protein